MTLAQDDLARRVADRLMEVRGVVAVALGGSLARGAGRPNSDVDLGIYYRPALPPAVAELGAAARDLSRSAESLVVTAFGEWGPWVNGGAWLHIDGQKVDWLYRDLDKVERVIAECTKGVVTCDYYLGHPHGFHNHIYMAEVHYGRPLADPGAVLDQLKQRTRRYPAALKQAIVKKYLYDATFMLNLATNPAARGDVFHVSGCLFRCAAALVQVLFAQNERYFMNEKGAVEEVEAFISRPPAFGSRLRTILAAPGHDAESLQKSCRAMAELLTEARTLVDGAA